MTPELSALPPAAVDPPSHRWPARPAVARAVQLVVLVVPALAAIATALVLSSVLPTAHDVGAALLWWAVVLIGSTAVMVAVDRLARRLLPLAVLLRLSLLFPDQAPKRYKVAARDWSTRRVRAAVETGRTSDGTQAPYEVAQRIVALLASLAAHDRRTRGHCERVRAYTDLLAAELGLAQHDVDRLRWAALIHDIGKLKVSPRLLNKPGKPTEREWHSLRAHPLRGAEIAAPLADWLGTWAAAIEEHHERWDGQGYPHGLAGTDISIGARIVAVADAFEVMTSLRPYGRPVSPEAARTELAACAGTHFDPMVVRAFLNISLGRLRKAMGPLVWFAQVPILAGMPRLEAAIIGGGRAAVGAGAAGAVAVAITPSAPAPPAVHHEPVAPPTVAAVTAVAPSPPDKPTSTPPSAARTHRHHHHHAAAAAADRSSPRAGRDSGPSSSAAATRPRRSAGPTAEPATADGPTASRGHRCDGNAGAGVGNGGPKILLDPLPGLPPGARRALEQAPGITACDR